MVFIFELNKCRVLSTTNQAELVQDWALGMSRLFLKAGQLKALEDLRSKGGGGPRMFKPGSHSRRACWVAVSSLSQAGTGTSC